MTALVMGYRTDVSIGRMECKVIPEYFPDSRSPCCALQIMSPRTADSRETMLQAIFSIKETSSYYYEDRLFSPEFK